MSRRMFDPFAAMRETMDAFFNDDFFRNDPFLSDPFFSTFRPRHHMLDNGDRFEIRRESRHDREPPVHHNQSTPKIEEVICSEDDEDNRLEAGRSRANVVVEEPDEIHSTIAPASIPERRRPSPVTQYSSSSTISFKDSSGRVRKQTSVSRLAPDGHLETRKRYMDSATGQHQESFERTPFNIAGRRTQQPYIDFVRDDARSLTGHGYQRIGIGSNGRARPSRTDRHN